MFFFKRGVVLFILLTFAEPVETQYTMRPFIGECAPYSNACEDCIGTPGCYYYTMEVNKTQGDLCCPWYKNVQSRQFATNQFRTISQYREYFGTTTTIVPEVPTTTILPQVPTSTILPEVSTEEDKLLTVNDGRIPTIIGVLFGLLLLLLLTIASIFCCWRYRNRRQDCGLN